MVSFTTGAKAILSFIFMLIFVWFVNELIIKNIIALNYTEGWLKIVMTAGSYIIYLIALILVPLLIATSED